MLDLHAYTGRYGRLHVDADVTLAEDGDGLTMRVQHSGPLALADAPDQSDVTLTLPPVDHSLFLAASPAAAEPAPLVFFDFDGPHPRRFHFGGRAHTRR